MEKIDEVFAFYNAGAEMGRLERGLGKVELYRTKEILKKYITHTNTKIFYVLNTNPLNTQQGDAGGTFSSTWSLSTEK